MKKPNARAWIVTYAAVLAVSTVTRAADVTLGDRKNLEQKDAEIRQEEAIMRKHIAQHGHGSGQVKDDQEKLNELRKERAALKATLEKDERLKSAENVSSSAPSGGETRGG